MPKESTDKKLDLLIDIMTKMAATPVAVVAPIAPIAPVAPVAPVDTSINQELVVKFTRLEENVKLNFQQVKDAINALSDGTASRIAALENEKLNARDSYASLYKAAVDEAIKDLKAVSTNNSTWITRGLTGGSVIVFLLGILQFIVGKYA